MRKQFDKCTIIDSESEAVPHNKLMVASSLFFSLTLEVSNKVHCGLLLPDVVCRCILENEALLT